MHLRRAIIHSWHDFANRVCRNDNLFVVNPQPTPLLSVREPIARDKYARSTTTRVQPVQSKSEAVGPFVECIRPGNGVTLQ